MVLDKIYCIPIESANKQSTPCLTQKLVLYLCHICVHKYPRKAAGDTNGLGWPPRLWGLQRAAGVCRGLWMAAINHGGREGPWEAAKAARYRRVKGGAVAACRGRGRLGGLQGVARRTTGRKRLQGATKSCEIQLANSS
jgi:hypothetical protein